MFTHQETVVLRIGNSELIFNRTFVLSALYMAPTKSWLIKAARPGYIEIASELDINSSMNCNFGDLYEVRLLKGNALEVSVLVTKLPIMESAENIFNASSILNNAQSGTSFTELEADVLKRQLDEMSVRISEIITQMANVSELHTYVFSELTL